METSDLLNPDEFFGSLSKEMLVKAVHPVSMYALSQIPFEGLAFKEYWIHNDVYDPSPLAADYKIVLKSAPLNFGFDLILSIRKNPTDWYIRAESWRDKIIKEARE